MTSDPRTMDIRLQGNPQLHYGVNGGAGRSSRPGEDDALKSLSQEEQECLQFFEKTIDSLEESLEENDQRRTPASSSRPARSVNRPQTSHPIVSSLLARHPSPKDQDIIYLVRPEPDLVQTKEPIFNPTSPDFQSMMQNPESHFEIKPRRDPKDNLPSEYNPPLPSGSYGPTESPSSYHPPGCIPTPVLIAQKIADNQAGGTSNFSPPSFRSPESDKSVSPTGELPVKHGPPISAKPNRFPGNINIMLGNKEHQNPSLANVSIQERRAQMLANLTGTSNPLLQEAPQLALEQMARNTPTRSISFKDPSPAKSRMEALSKLGLNRNRAMSAGVSQLAIPSSISLDPQAGAETSAKPLEASDPPTTETSDKPLEASSPPTTATSTKPLAPPPTEISAKPLEVSAAPTIETSAKALEASALPTIETSAKALEASAPPTIETSAKALEASAPPTIETSAKALEASALPTIETSAKALEASAPPTIETSAKALEANAHSTIGTSAQPLQTSAKPLEASAPPTTETSAKLPEVNIMTPCQSPIHVDRKPEILQIDSPRRHEDRNHQLSPSPPAVTRSRNYPPPLDVKASFTPLPEVTSLESNSYGGKSIVVNPSVSSKSELIAPTSHELKIHPTALANLPEFNTYGGKTKVMNPAHVAVTKSHLPDILSSHIDKSQTLPTKSEPLPTELNNYGGKSRTFNPSTGISRPSVSPAKSVKAPAPTPAPRPPRHSYHGTTQKPVAQALSPEHRGRSSSMFRPQGITVQFSGRGAMDESRREALRKLGLLKES